MSKRKNKLELLREEIDALDARLATVFLRRMELCEQIAFYKKHHGLPILDEARERELLCFHGMKLSAENREETAALFKTILELSRARQARVLLRADSDARPKVLKAPPS